MSALYYIADPTNPQTAIDDCAAAGGGTVLFPTYAGNYEIPGEFGLDVHTGVTLNLNRQTLEWTYNQSSPDAYLVRQQPGSDVINGRLYSQQDNADGWLLSLDAGSETFKRWQHTTHRNLLLQSQNLRQLNGLRYKASGADQYVQWCQSSNLSFHRLVTPVLLHTAAEESPCFVNGNTFNNIQIDWCERGIVLDGNGNTRPCSANVFANIQYETANKSKRVLEIGGNDNVFRNVMVFDWSKSTEDVGVEFNAGWYNEVTLRQTDINRKDTFFGGPQIAKQRYRYIGDRWQ